jgi:hypothetical protein
MQSTPGLGSGLCQLLQHFRGSLPLGLLLGGAAALDGDDADLALDQEVALQNECTKMNEKSNLFALIKIAENVFFFAGKKCAELSK